MSREHILNGVYVSETGTRSEILTGVYLNETVSTAAAPVTPVFSEYARPITRGLTAAVIATTIIGFVAPPPAQAAVQPTPVFSAFEQSARAKSAAHQQPSVIFNIAPSVAAAFTGFSDFGAAQAARAPQHEQSVRFEIGFLGPARTPDRLGAFSDFGQPSKPRATQDGFANAPQPPAVQNYVFGKYDQPQPKKPPLFDPSVQFTIQPPVVAAAAQAFVFSAFSQPPPVVRVAVHQQPQPAFEVTQVILAVTPSPLVFTQFSQPAFSRTYKVEQHPEVRFRVLRPDAATPGPGIFPPFEQPAFSRTFPPHQQPSVSYALATQQPAAPVVTGGDFADFGLPPKVINRAALEGFTNAPQPQPVQAYVFAPFGQPLRVPTVKEGQISFEIGFLGPASTPDRLTFSEFAQPKFARPSRDGFTNAPVAPVIQSYVFSLFEQPQFKRAGQLDQPVQFANPPASPAVQQPYVFGQFEQPGVRKYSAHDQGIQFEIVPPPPPAASSGPVFSPFEQPRFYKIIYQGDWVSFEVPFQGTAPPDITDGTTVLSDHKSGPGGGGLSRKKWKALQHEIAAERAVILAEQKRERDEKAKLKREAQEVRAAKIRAKADERTGEQQAAQLALSAQAAEQLAAQLAEAEALAAEIAMQEEEDEIMMMLLTS